MKTAASFSVIFLIVLVSGTSCSRSREPNDYYFPVGTLSESWLETDVDAEKRFRELSGESSREWSDEFRREWYSAYLRAMEEPSLSRGDVAVDAAYRFLWLRTFHNPIAVRIEKKGAAYTLYAVELADAEEAGSKIDVRREQKKLSQADYDELTAGLESTNPWEEWSEREPAGLDGAEWILEGYRDDCYQVANQWSPRSGEFREVCLRFLDAAGFVIPKRDVY